MNKLTSTFALGLALTIGAAAFAPAANAATTTVTTKPAVVQTTPAAAPKTIIEFATAIIKLQTEREASTKRYTTSTAAEKATQAGLDTALAKAAAEQKASTAARQTALDKAVADRIAAPKIKRDKALAAEKAAQIAREIARGRADAKNEQTRANAKVTYDAAQAEIMKAWQNGAKLDLVRQAQLNAEFTAALDAYDAKVISIKVGFEKDVAASNARVAAINAIYRTETANTDTDVAKLRAAHAAAKKAADTKYRETVSGPLLVKLEASKAKSATLEADYKRSTSEYWAKLNTLKTGLMAAKA